MDSWVTTLLVWIIIDAIIGLLSMLFCGVVLAPMILFYMIINKTGTLTNRAMAAMLVLSYAMTFYIMMFILKLGKN